jgi:anti-sigma B factor antagonist
MTDTFHIDVPHTDGDLAVIAFFGEFDITAAPAVRTRKLLAFVMRLRVRVLDH